MRYERPHPQLTGAAAYRSPGPMEEMALGLILRDPKAFGRAAIEDQIALRKSRLAQFSDHARVAEIQDELAKLQAALPAE